MKLPGKTWGHRLTLAGFALMIAGTLAFFLFPSTFFSPPPGELGYEANGERRLFNLNDRIMENGRVFPAQIRHSVIWQTIQPDFVKEN